MVAQRSVIPQSAAILYRDGMELKENVLLTPPAPTIEANLTLSQGMEIRHLGDLVTVTHAITPQGHQLTSEFQNKQMTGVDEFCSALAQFMPAGTLMFTRTVNMQIHYRPDAHIGILETFIFQGKTVVFAVPGNADMKTPGAIDKMCPVVDLRVVKTDLSYDASDRLRSAHGANNFHPEIRIVMPEIIGVISAIMKAAPVNGVEVETGSISQLAWRKAAKVGNAEKLHPRSKNSALERATGDRKKKLKTPAAN